MITKPLLIAIGVLTAALGLASFGLYKQVQANGELSEQINQHKVAIAAHSVAWRFTDGVMSSQQEIVKNAETKTDSHSGNVTTANDSAERLRKQLETYIEQSADDRAGFAEYRKTAEARIRMLALLHGESDRRAGIYADQADKNKIAGDACESAYNELVGWIRKTYGVK
jgi:type II secretory pathway pseudopilin PulG